jgi:hypothetical protein
MVSAIKTSWTAATLARPRAICYLSLGSWEDFRGDAAQFPPGTLGYALNGFPNERWLDVRQLSILQPLIDGRLSSQCAAKGFDAVEIDNIDGFDPASTTGFQLTEQDGQAFLAYQQDPLARDGRYLEERALCHCVGKRVRRRSDSGAVLPVQRVLRFPERGLKAPAGSDMHPAEWVHPLRVG